MLFGNPQDVFADHQVQLTDEWRVVYTIEIRVTNLWVNRLIRDAQPDTAVRITYSVPKAYRGTEALIPSGLLGPVRLEQIHAAARKSSTP